MNNLKHCCIRNIKWSNISALSTQWRLIFPKRNININPQTFRRIMMEHITHRSLSLSLPLLSLSAGVPGRGPQDTSCCLTSHWGTPHVATPKWDDPSTAHSPPQTHCMEQIGTPSHNCSWTVWHFWHVHTTTVCGSAQLRAQEAAHWVLLHDSRRCTDRVPSLWRWRGT